MTTLIDQRILISAPVTAVWSVLADQDQLSAWRVDCQRVEFITSRHFGVGTQRQLIPPQGRPFQEEITAWYEGVGYEYRRLSKGYRSWTARLRLQALPEGTLVQWTINYQPKGLINFLLDKIGGEAKYTEESRDSLLKLREVVLALGHNLEGEPRKRQTLQPVARIVKSATQPMIILSEDSAADTKPRRPDGLDEAIQAQNAAATLEHTPPVRPITEQNFKRATPLEMRPVTSEQLESPASQTQPKPPTPIMPQSQVREITPPPSPPLSTAPATPPQTPAVPPVKETAKESLPPGMPESIKATPPQGIPKVDLSRLRYAEAADNEQRPLEDEPDFDPADSAQNTQLMRPGLPPPTSVRDTGEVSIWEAFGITAPSKIDGEALDALVRDTGSFNAISFEEDQAEAEHQAETDSPTDEQPSAEIALEQPFSPDDTMTFSPLDLGSSLLRVRASQTPTGLRHRQARASVPVRKAKPALKSDNEPK